MALRPVLRLEFLESIRPFLLAKLLVSCEDQCLRHDLALPDSSQLKSFDPSSNWTSRVCDFINREQPQPLTQALMQIRDLSQDPDVDYFGDDAPCDSLHPPLTPAERALLVFLNKPEAFENAYLSVLPPKTCSFIEFLAPVPESFNAEDPAKISALQKTLGDWFRQQHCTHFCDVHVLQMPEEVRWSFIHGRRPRSQGFIENMDDPWRRFSTVFPDQHDLIVLCLKSGRLLIHARCVDEAEQYRRQLGTVYWANPEHFALAHIYSLNAFQVQGEDLLSCDDVEGVERVELRQLDLKKPQTNTVLLSLRGKNLRQHVPPGTIGQCLNEYDVHRVKLACFADGQSSPQLISIKPPNRISFDLRSDNSAAINFLIAKGVMSAHFRASALFRGSKR